MTEGRFETVYNCRPNNWDNRNFWTKTRPGNPAERDLDHERDHMERESCPFHDLRADGRFQPEYWGPGVGGKVYDPHKLVERPGHRMNTSTGHHNDQLGCGGTLMPCDTDPGRPSLDMTRGVDNRPWCSTKKNTDLFSVPPYVTVPPPEQIIPPVEKFFHTGKNVPYLNKMPPFIPDEYGVKVKPAKPAFRLKAGKVPYKLDPRLKFEPGEATKTRKDKASKKPIPRTPYFPRQNVRGTFGAFPRYIPEPYDYGQIRSYRPPIFTYHTHTKRSMPVGAPWTTGCETVEPRMAGSASAALRASSGKRDGELRKAVAEATKLAQSRASSAPAGKRSAAPAAAVVWA